jgi:hypothetical protein
MARFFEFAFVFFAWAGHETNPQPLGLIDALYILFAELDQCLFLE